MSIEQTAQRICDEISIWHPESTLSKESILPYLERAKNAGNDFTEPLFASLRKNKEWILSHNEPQTRNAIITALFQISLFTATPLQQGDRVDESWRTALLETENLLPKGSLKREISLICSKIDWLDFGPKNAKHTARARVIARKGEAFQLAQQVIGAFTKKPFNSSIVNKKFNCYVTQLAADIMVKNRWQHFAEQEELCDQLMRLSLTGSSTPIWKIPNGSSLLREQDHENPLRVRTTQHKKMCDLATVNIMQRELFTNALSQDSLFVSPFQQFTLFQKLQETQKQNFFYTLSEESQLVLQRLLELQPLDHHDSNIGISTKAEVVFFDNTHILYRSNSAVFFRTKENIRFHLVPVRSCLLDLASSRHPLPKSIVEALLDPKHECELIGWLEKSYHPHVRLQTTPYKLALQTMRDIEKEMADQVEQYTRNFMIHSEICHKTAKRLFKKSRSFMPQHWEQENLLSLLPRYNITSLDALKERLKNRRQFLEDCHAFDQKPAPELYNTILDRESTPIPSTAKASLKKSYQPLALAKWMVPSYQSVACSMFALLSDSLLIIHTLNIQKKESIGDYLFPLESLLYRYLKTLCNTKEEINALMDIKIAMRTKQTDSPLALIEKLFSRLDSSGKPVPLRLEVMHILKRLKNDTLSSFVDVNRSILDPDI